MAVAMLSNRDSLDMLHHEIGQTCFGSACVINNGDIWVVQQRKGLAFGLETGDYLPRIHARLDDFQRNHAFYRFILLSKVNNGKTALAKHTQELVRPDLPDLSGSFSFRISKRACREIPAVW